MIDEDYFTHKLYLEQQELYAQWEITHKAWVEAKAHNEWAKEHQLSESFKAVHDSGLCSAKTKEEIDKVFDKLPGIA